MATDFREQQSSQTVSSELPFSNSGAATGRALVKKEKGKPLQKKRKIAKAASEIVKAQSEDPIFFTVAESKSGENRKTKNIRGTETSKTSSINISLESRRYIGNKAKLASWIIEIIKTETKNTNSFADVFAGTGSVSKTALNHFKTVIINDILHSNNIIYKAFFSVGFKDDKKIASLLNKYNCLDPNEIQDNYFSLNFGGKFFDYNSAKLIGHIRGDIEAEKNDLTEKEYSVLLTTLI